MNINRAAINGGKNARRWMSYAIKSYTGQLPVCLISSQEQGYNPLDHVKPIQAEVLRVCEVETKNKEAKKTGHIYFIMEAPRDLGGHKSLKDYILDDAVNGINIYLGKSQEVISEYHWDDDPNSSKSTVNIASKKKRLTH